MKKGYLTLDYLSKIQVTTPLFLFVGCDGSRGDELGIVIGTTFFLALLLSLIEPYYRNATTTWIAIKWAMLCAIATVLASLVELIVLEKMGKLHGPFGYYGIPLVILCVSAFFSVFAVVCAWNDREKPLNK